MDIDKYIEQAKLLKSNSYLFIRYFRHGLHGYTLEVKTVSAV